MHAAMHCEWHEGCRKPAVYAVQSLQHLTWQTVVEHANRLKEAGRLEEVDRYLRYLPLASRGIGTFPINFAYVEEQRAVDRFVLHRRFLDDRRYTRLDERASDMIRYVLQASLVQSDTCVFKIVLPGTAKMLAECLTSEESREVRVINDKHYLFKFCEEHRRTKQEEEDRMEEKEGDCIEEEEEEEVEEEEMAHAQGICLAKVRNNMKNVEIAIFNGQVYLGIPGQ